MSLYSKQGEAIILREIEIEIEQGAQTWTLSQQWLQNNVLRSTSKCSQNTHI